MKLYDDWRMILRKAWSIKFMILAGFFTACEAILPLYDGMIPRGVFTALTFLAVCGGLIARLVAQKDV